MTSTPFLPARGNRRVGWAIGTLYPLCVVILLAIVRRAIPVAESFWMSWAGGVLLGLIMLAAVTDATSQRIPNWVTYCAFLWGIGINLLSLGGEATSRWLPISINEFGAVGLGDSLAGGVVCFGTMLFIYRMAGSGAGDVKLAAAIGTLIGLRAGLSVLIWTYLVAGVSIVVWFLLTVGPILFMSILIRKLFATVLPSSVSPPTEEESQLVLGRRIRLGPAFALGTWLTVSYENLLEGFQW